mmetsp:Transcript_24774/g.67534  ORF Transcript_24774/g.67534 Transcript_24774/m.67534 type:complete len:107 (-) Transcript_24774:181-501(-)|eukprot:1137674-Pelagomonas_calceolata.AAC.3
MLQGGHASRQQNRANWAEASIRKNWSRASWVQTNNTLKQSKPCSGPRIPSSLKATLQNTRTDQARHKRKRTREQSGACAEADARFCRHIFCQIADPFDPFSVTNEP